MLYVDTSLTHEHYSAIMCDLQPFYTHIIMLTKEQIKERLKDANISQVARNSGVHRNQIARVLKGKEIMGDAMVKLISYLEK